MKMKLLQQLAYYILISQKAKPNIYVSTKGIIWLFPKQKNCRKVFGWFF